jgi:amino acid transporter
LAGFLANSLFWFGYCAIAAAAILNAMADMLSIWFPLFSLYWFRVVFLLLVLAFFAWVNMRAVQSGARLVIIVTTLKIIPLILLIVIGLFGIKGENLIVTTWPDMGTFGVACLMLFFAFGGSEAALSNSGEMIDPGKSIPKGIFMGLSAVLLIYLGLQFVTLGVMGASLATFTEAPLAATAESIVGPIGGTMLIAAAAISMFGNTGGDVLASSRLPFAAAKDGLLPDILGRVHPRFKTPHVSIAFYTGVIFLLAISGGFKSLAILASSSTLLIYLGVVLAMFKSRLKPDPTDVPQFKVPGGYVVPTLSLGVLAWLLAQVPMKEFIALTLFFLLVTGFYFGFGWWKRKANSA